MRKLIILTIAALLFSQVPVVNAAGVVLSFDDNTEAAGAPVSVVLSWTATDTDYLTNDTIVLHMRSNDIPTMTTIVGDFVITDVDLDGGGDETGSWTLGTDGYATFTFTADDAAIGTSRDITITVPTLSAGVYSMSMIDSRAGDFGAVLLYIDSDNVVTVTADVEPELSLVLRTYTDAQNLGDDNDSAPGSAATNETPNVCSLGSLSISSVATCDYRLKVYTNASDGYTVQIASNGDLSKAGAGAVADVDDIDLIGEGATVAAGTEGYGIAFNGGAATIGSVTESGDFNDDDTPLPAVATDLYTVDGPNSPGAVDTTNTALVIHRAAIDTGTAAGHYVQTVTYTVTADF